MCDFMFHIEYTFIVLVSVHPKNNQMYLIWMVSC